MFEKISRSWELVKASAEVLRSDKELLLFPLISGACTLLVLATFLWPAFSFGVFRGEMGIGAAVLGFAFYFCQYSVIIFFNCALVAAAMIRLEGGNPTLADGVSAARARLPSILGYAAIVATVGVLLQFLKSRDNFLVRVLGGGLGVAWTLATFLIVPVLVSRDIGPVDALKQSVHLLKRTWGENAVGTVGIGMAFSLLGTLVVTTMFVLAILAAKVSVGLAIATAVAGVIISLLLAIYHTALSGVYSAVLYRYAMTQEAPAAFQRLDLAHAFQRKGER